MDGSHIRGSPSIPPCTCHSGLRLLRVYRCSSHWRGRRVSCQSSGRALSPTGDSCTLGAKHLDTWILDFSVQLRSCIVVQWNLFTSQSQGRMFFFKHVHPLWLRWVRQAATPVFVTGSTNIYRCGFQFLSDWKHKDRRIKFFPAWVKPGSMWLNVVSLTAQCPPQLTAVTPPSD